MTNNTAFWKGQSGRKYEYKALPIYGNNWNDVAGNYIFAKIVGSYWQAVYVGQTESFEKRMPGHNELPCVRRNGATHIHVHTNANHDARLAEEKDLIRAHQPACNEQHKAA